MEFDMIALDLDGGRGEGSPYKEDDEGTDNLANAYNNEDPNQVMDIW